ncbi:MAG: GGDEF domain-containing protein [Actinomycetota bacterium]
MAWPWRFDLIRPASVFLVGVLVTLLVAALVSQQDAESRVIRFGYEVDRAEREVIDTMADTRARIATAVNFVEATHPVPLASYERFMTAEEHYLATDDPGVTFLELIDEGLEAEQALAERERLLDNDGFAVRTIVPVPGERLVVTRTSREPGADDTPVRGLDATILAQWLFPDGLPQDKVAVVVVPGEQFWQLLGVLRTDLEADYMSLLVAPVFGADGAEIIGYAFRFLSTDQIFAEVLGEERADGIEIAIRSADADGDIVAATAGFGSGALLRERRPVAGTDGLTIEVHADDRFTPPPGPFDHPEVWGVGLALSLLAAIGVAWQRRQTGLVRTAEFERELALTLSQTDSLTGLLNRQGFIHAAGEALAGGCSMTVYFIDLDGFKAVNDAEGHAAGDELLRGVAATLRGIFRVDDIIGRLGGDEFVVCVRSLQTADRVDRSVADAVTRIRALHHELGASIGVAHGGRAATVDIDELLRLADEAMYEAKRAGGNRHVLA